MVCVDESVKCVGVGDLALIGFVEDHPVAHGVECGGEVDEDEKEGLASCAGRLDDLTQAVCVEVGGAGLDACVRRQRARSDCKRWFRWNRWCGLAEAQARWTGLASEGLVVLGFLGMGVTIVPLHWVGSAPVAASLRYSGW